MNENGTSIAPDSAAGWLQRTRNCHDARDWPNCLQAANETLDRDPECAEAELMRATALLSLRRPGDAAASVSRVIAALPDDGGLHVFLARCFMAQQKFAEAVAPCRRARALMPESAQAGQLLGACLKRTGALDEAAAMLEQVVQAAPEHYAAWNDLADIHIARGAVPEALRCLRRSLQHAPYNLDAMSSLCFYTAFDVDTDAAALFELKQDWGRWLTAHRPALPDLPTPAPRPDDRLRIGYLAYDMTEGMTARFLEPVLARHDHARFHITGYHGNEIKDSVTRRLGSLTDSWQDVSQDSVAQSVARIRRDGIDILVLASSYRGKDLRVLANRAAPLQVCYLNRIASTGLDTVDYLITDALSDPVGETERFYTESLIRLSNHTVYQPPAAAPLPGPLPCLANSHVTFGSFNNHAKINSKVVDAWARILLSVPKSRLILRSAGYFDDPAARNRLRDLFVGRGVAEARLEFQGMRASQAAHLAGMREADIALDPFPFNGGTTSLEALWLGIPVVSLATDSFMGRQGLRCLAKIGVPELASDDVDEYVSIAVSLAGDWEKLATLRRTLPARVTAKLFDYDEHVRELESAYSKMWACHDAGAPPEPFSIRNETRVNE